ncbi:MAG: kelch repeat-containing protein [Bacteroidota bacterium]|nr:kelch repeat-containing protein [Bacteroidota bacterium]
MTIYNLKYFLYALLVTTLISCSSDDDDSERGNWIERSVFDGTPRSNAAGFTIGSTGYMGTGYDGDDYLTDFWSYNIEGDYWEQLTDFPGEARSSASGFAIDSKGYIGIGYNGEEELQDFYEYDPSSNSWTQQADFMGGPRRAAIGFGINGNGFIGTGYDGDNDLKDFYKFDPVENEWSLLVGFGGEKRRNATAFSINGKVYLGTGVSNGLYKEDFWVFDPNTEIFTRLNDLDEDDDYSITRSNAVSFELGGYGYITTGYIGGATATTWEYDPTADTWEEITALEGNIRQDALGFSNGDRAYVLLGRSGSLYMDDIYELHSQEEYDDED